MRREDERSWEEDEQTKRKGMGRGHRREEGVDRKE